MTTIIPSNHKPQTIVPLISVSKKTRDFQPVANKKLREQGFLQLKTKEFTNVNDCFLLKRNAVIGVFLLPLINI